MCTQLEMDGIDLCVPVSIWKMKQVGGEVLSWTHEEHNMDSMQ